ncbi:flagellar biosynthesis repressor FlbT [Seohaeicola nanhaiensis]|uniref:Flagellar biosynthesis repressor FlbT n=1 Tax=Seohaeicola nanhaiensis TaxID=1387282 RepID=A0ABV9KIV3_9RHOB
MVLKLTLKPYERFIVNGCAIRNSGRRHSLVIEAQADVVRGKDLLDGSQAVTVVNKVYFLIQTALTRADLREKLVPTIQQNLAQLATVFGPPTVGHIFEAANYVSKSDFYKALKQLQPVMEYENELMNHISATHADPDEAQPSQVHG